MEWPEALETVVARTKHEPYRALCADGQPHADVWRRRMLRMAGQPAPEPTREPAVQPSYPSLATQAVNAVHAVGRIASAVIRHEPIKVSQEDHDHRMGICVTCDQYDPVQERCRSCACYMAVKPWLKTESCPLKKW